MCLMCKLVRRSKHGVLPSLQMIDVSGVTLYDSTQSLSVSLPLLLTDV